MSDKSMIIAVSMIIFICVLGFGLIAFEKQTGFFDDYKICNEWKKHIPNVTCELFGERTHTQIPIITINTKDEVSP